jgi:thioredoxin 1
MVAPIIDELTEEYRGRVKVAQINVDDNPNTAMEYRVMSIPTIILFRDGQPVETLVGAQPKRNFVARIEQHVGQGASA